jgi:hypothetical protein
MKIIRIPEPIQEEISNEPDIKSIFGEVNRFGVKIVIGKSGHEQWIIDAKTGKQARRENYDCMESNGLYLWVKKGEKLRSIDGIAYPSVW